jgi:hypothetical protein
MRQRRAAAPTPPVVDRRIGGVRSIAPLVPNNSRPGPAVPISVPGKRGARPSTRPVPAPASTAIRSDAQVRAEMQLGHGVQQDVLLALATRSLISGCGASTARQLWDPRRVGLFSGVRRGQPGAAGVPPAPVASSGWSYSGELAALERRRPKLSA